MWAIIASVRAYRITGNTAYRDMAALNFDQTYARSWSADLGGGLWWTTQRTEKNTTTNGPAAIAACELYQVSHNPKYLSEAESIYAWERKYLYDPRHRRRLRQHPPGDQQPRFHATPLEIHLQPGHLHRRGQPPVSDHRQVRLLRRRAAHADLHEQEPHRRRDPAARGQRQWQYRRVQGHLRPLGGRLRAGQSHHLVRRLVPAERRHGVGASQQRRSGQRRLGPPDGRRRGAQLARLLLGGRAAAGAGEGG